MEICLSSSQVFSDLPLIEPKFGNIGDPPRAVPATEEVFVLQQRVEFLEKTIGHKDQHIAHLEALIKQIESGRLMKLLREMSVQAKGERSSLPKYLTSMVSAAVQETPAREAVIKIAALNVDRIPTRCIA